MTRTTRKEYWRITATDNTFDYVNEFETLDTAIDFIKQKSSQKQQFLITWNCYCKEFRNGIFKKEITEKHAMFLMRYINQEWQLDII